MKSRIPSKYAFELRKVEGEEFLDFGHRIFTADLRQLKDGEGRLCLLLSPDAKLRQMFWCFRASVKDFALIYPASSTSFVQDIEAFKFAESFEFSPPEPVSTFWTEEQPFGEGMGQITSEHYLGCFRSTLFSFEAWRSEKDKALQDWQTYRVQKRIPYLKIDSSDDRIIFDWGLEEFCAAQKGCYVGQEIVERVRSRGGSAVNEFVPTLWNGRVEGFEDLLVEGKRVGGLSGDPLYRADRNETMALAFVAKRAREKPLLSASTGCHGRIVADKFGH